MPIFQATFGSFGDIVTIVQLALSIKQALDDSRGSAAEFQALSSYLETFTQHLDCTRKPLLAAQLPDTTVSGIPIAPIEAALRACERHLTEFQRRMRKYIPSLRPGGSGSRVVDGYRKLQWAIYGRPFAKELRQSLMEESILINDIYTALQLEESL